MLGPVDFLGIAIVALADWEEPTVDVPPVQSERM